MLCDILYMCVITLIDYNYKVQIRANFYAYWIYIFKLIWKTCNITTYKFIIVYIFRISSRKINLDECSCRENQLWKNQWLEVPSNPQLQMLPPQVTLANVEGLWKIVQLLIKYYNLPIVKIIIYNNYWCNIK